MCCSFIFGVKTKKTIKPNSYKTTNPLIIYLQQIIKGFYYKKRHHKKDEQDLSCSFKRFVGDCRFPLSA